MNFLKFLPGVLSYAPNHAYSLARTPNDPLVSQQFALSQVNAFGGWEYEVGVSGKTTVVMIDTGISPVADLAGKILSQGAAKSKFCSAVGCLDNDPPTPACNHATRTAGIAAASSDNGVAIAGMSWGAQLLSLKVFADGDCAPSFPECSSLGCKTSDAALANAIAYAVTLQNTAAAGKIVINISIGGPGTCPGSGCPGGANCFELTKAAMDAAVLAGIPVVVSAGNDGGAVNVPANCAGTAGGSGIMPVGATDANNNVAVFSSRGPELAANGLVAPGQAIVTTDLNSNTTLTNGTSFSAPAVAGLAALILSAKPNFSAAQVQSAIRGGADGIGVSALGLDAGGRPLGNVSGAGRMNAFRAMRLAVNGTLSDFEGDQKAIAFPNPFWTERSGSVSFSIPLSLQGAQTKIKVYTIAGELIKELSGLTWDGKNEDGRMVASGTYMFLVSTDKGTTRGRLALIR
jgi:subtilisin family serine protease